MTAVKCEQMLDRFLTFYDLASKTPPHERLSLWKEHYAFPHTPPGYQNDQLAKEMLEYGWGQYPLAYERIKYFEMDPVDLNDRFDYIKQTMRYTEPISLTVLFFVGTFETDPFIVKEEDTYTLCFPVELEASESRLIQELARVVHCSRSGLAPSFTRTLGQLLFQEGVALHTTQALLEDDSRFDPCFTWDQEGCTREPNRVMINILPHLHRTDYEALYSFTKGTGASGYEKEANYTGWLVVSHLLEQGYSLPELVRIPKGDVDAIVEKSLFALLNKAYTKQPQE
ncbi:hypothetical protein QRD89_05205 [Halobacillus sp. ACCC02827]|uniref:hypothetical protein n=1 Tax=Bacillaceae TaxID=186817 RepID=UPI0002A4DE01|nr:MULTISPECIES: hypothetical protein [Bacillaceae]ELK47624.1 hypothetical protein D479_05980 [Halobacillus sp. BAB-2008]QHT45936.1 hypothetical protein M662_05335 [Bacillus sp. SB49]WJE16746.1 hypothetical protein QRD89_05205 [Halobacillus sp. ACCC02827]